MNRTDTVTDPDAPDPAVERPVGTSVRPQPEKAPTRPTAESSRAEAPHEPVVRTQPSREDASAPPTASAHPRPAVAPSDVSAPAPAPTANAGSPASAGNQILQEATIALVRHLEAAVQGRTGESASFTLRAGNEAAVELRISVRNRHLKINLSSGSGRLLRWLKNNWHQVEDSALARGFTLETTEFTSIEKNPAASRDLPA